MKNDYECGVQFICMPGFISSPTLINQTIARFRLALHSNYCQLFPNSFGLFPSVSSIPFLQDSVTFLLFRNSESQVTHDRVFPFHRPENQPRRVHFVSNDKWKFRQGVSGGNWVSDGQEGHFMCPGNLMSKLVAVYTDRSVEDRKIQWCLIG